MTWVRLDDGFPEHPKLVAVGPVAGWLHVCALCWCSRQLTDGHIPEGIVSRLADVPRPMREVERLVAAGLWVPDTAIGGWWIHDYAEFQVSRESALAHREAVSAERRRSGAAGNHKRWGHPGPFDGCPVCASQISQTPRKPVANGVATLGDRCGSQTDRPTPDPPQNVSSSNGSSSPALHVLPRQKEQKAADRR